MFHLALWKSRNDKTEVRQDEPDRGLDGDGYPLARLCEKIDSLMAGFLENRRLENRILGYRSALSDNARFHRNWGSGWEGREKEYIFRVGLPGFDAEDFDVQLDGGVLNICARHNQEETAVTNGSRHRCCSINRTLTLPEAVDANRIAAHYHDGVFEIRVPDAEELLRHKRIEVNDD